MTCDTGMSDTENILFSMRKPALYSTDDEPPPLLRDPGQNISHLTIVHIVYALMKILFGVLINTLFKSLLPDRPCSLPASQAPVIDASSLLGDPAQECRTSHILQ